MAWDSWTKLERKQGCIWYISIILLPTFEINFFPWRTKMRRAGQGVYCPKRYNFSFFPFPIKSSFPSGHSLHPLLIKYFVLYICIPVRKENEIPWRVGNDDLPDVEGGLSDHESHVGPAHVETGQHLVTPLLTKNLRKRIIEVLKGKK